MPTSRPFAYNTGAAISGTTQVGNIAVGTPTSGFTGTPKWWNGPDEELGYVIAIPVSANTQPTPVSGVTASVGFNRSTALTDSSFIEIANLITGQSFSTASQASTFLTSNGYWNSYIPDRMGLYYKFDGNFNDSSGNGNNGTGSGTYSFSPSFAAKTGFTQGVSIQPAPQGFVTIPSSITYQGNGGQNYSFFTWVNRQAGSGTRGTVFDNIYWDAPSIETGFGFYVSSTAGSGVRLITLGGVIDIQTGTINVGTWYHIGFTIQDNGTPLNRFTLKVYINGALSSSATTSGSDVIDITNAQNATIGAQTINTNGFVLRAWLDEMVIYNKTLSQTEITALYNRTTPIF
jgi:hypothetical protein